MINYTTKYDDSLLEIGSYDEEKGFYNSFPQMLPWIGKDYISSNYKRLLLVGESHYLPDSAHNDLYNPNIWYNENHSDYYSEGEDEEQYTNTRQIINPGKWKSNAHNIYRDPEKIIKRIVSEKNPNVDCTQNFFSFISYYNYFLRPAPKGKSMREFAKQIDENIARDAFNGIIEILDPQYVFFISLFAFKMFQKNHNHKNYPFIVGYSAHPCCSWWNRPTKMNSSGKSKFLDFICDNKIFEK